ncbi:MAG TPA: chemotaxis protein CheA [Gemmatimonadales bacterium]|nr:chemotaxis protein CheA [Gemmatimonadales bacterium]
MSDMDEVVREFLVESREGLDQLDADLVALERDPTDRELLARIFRCIHTIKGTSGFLALARLEAVTHVGENLLARLRDGALALTPARAGALLRLVDAVREMLDALEATGSDGDREYDDLVAELTRLQDPDADAVPRPLGELLVERGAARPEQVAAALARQAGGDRRPLGEILVEQDGVAAGALQEALRAQQEGRAPASDTTIRVDVGLLDKLMTLVGELVLARNQILQYSAGRADPAFVATSQRLDLLTTELQEGVMKTRMQPIGNVWSKFPRVVRDLAVACGKRVRIEMEGQETELDRTILEAIKDPLTHIVRNSVDHGIEPPDVRVARGKPAEGRLHLRAYHEGGQVNIEISDDGRGIDAERVRAKAVERGLVSPEQAARMGERELHELIFLPGFSTAEQVTNVSGRGVGMDVVKTNIERIGGTIDVQSVPGQGTTLRIKIPLTLAIIPALVVTAAGDRYAIPQVNLLELVRLDGADDRRIEHVYGAPVYRLRGELLPLVYLTEALRVEPGARTRETANIVVLQAGDRSFGLVVDEINDTEEIVVKPLGKQLKGIAAYAGATIMGDGRVALILDVLGLAQDAGVLAESRDRRRAEEAERAVASETAAGRRSLLLFAVGQDARGRPRRRFAIPLSEIARLEEIPAERVERACGQEVVQYRGGILPLVRLTELLGEEAGAARAAPALQVVVFTGRDGAVGLVVDRILDIVEERVEVEQPVRQDLVSATGVVQGQVTDFLDVREAVRRAGALASARLEPAAVEG